MTILRLTIVLAILSASFLFAGQILNEKAEISQTEFTIVQSGEELIVIDIRFPESVVVDSLVEGTRYDRVFIKGMGHLSKIGYPELPQTTRLLAIDAFGSFEVKVSDVQFLEYQEMMT